jgi:hypothetical protein
VKDDAQEQTDMNRGLELGSPDYQEYYTSPLH